jgi:outer membrane autotransporter protein
MRNASLDVNVSGGNLTMNDVTGNTAITGGIVNAHNVNNISLDGGTGGKANVNNIGGGVTLANNGELTVRGDITGATDGAGVLIFNSGGVAQTVTGAVGSVTQLTSIKYMNNSVTFVDPSLKTAELDFTVASGITVTTTGADLGSANITGASDDNTIIVTGDQNITGNISAFGNIQVNTLNTININTSNFLAGITAGTPEEVTAVISKDNLTISRLGSAAAPLLDVQFNGDTTIANAVYTDTATIDVGKKVSFEAALIAKTLTLSGAGSTAEFADNTVIDLSVSPGVVGQGIVNFAGSVDIKKDIGNISAINFNGNDPSKQVRLFANLAGKSNFKEIRVVLQDNTSMSAGASFASSTIELGDKTLTISNGDVTFTGDVIIKTDITTSANVTTVGNIVLDAAANNIINLSNMNSLTVFVNDSNAGDLSGNKEYKVVTTKSGDIMPFDATKIKIDNSGSTNQWEISYLADGTIIITEGPAVPAGGGWWPSSPGKSPSLPPKQTVEVKDPFEGLDLPEGFGDIPGMFEDITPGSEAASFAQLFQSMTRAEREETMVRLADAGSELDIILDAINDSTDRITTRVDFVGSGLISSDFITASEDPDPMSGVSAGDDDVGRYGIWASPFHSKNIQRKLGITSGHKADSTGMTIGFDTKTTDAMVVGGAATVINTRVKYQDYKSGDRTLIDSMVLTLYGIRQISNSFYLQGIANITSSSVINSDIRGAGSHKQIAKGKYTSTVFSGEISGGYKYKIRQAIVTPIVGLSYTHFMGDSYLESGTPNQNLGVTAKAAYKVGGILGIRVACHPYQVGNLLINPEVHAYTRQDLMDKKSKLEVRLDGIKGNLARKTTKPVRRFTNIGTNLNTKYMNSEFSIGYDATLSNKYIGHQGTIKVRVEF